MREIKFRSRRIDNGEWIYGSLVILNGRCFIFNDECRAEVDPATVGQYTGIKDKNGKEIYEGDILTDEYKSIGTIEWVNGEFVVCFGDVGMYSLSNYFDGSCQMGVIGNIHDNPELINRDNYE